MSKIDSSKPEWQPLADGNAVPAATWNTVLADIVAAVNAISGEATTGNIAAAGLRAANIEGTAATLTKPGAATDPQVIARDTTVTGAMNLLGEWSNAPALLWEGSFVARPDIINKGAGYIGNESGAAQTITGLTTTDGGGLREGQRFLLFIAPGTDDVTLEHGTDAGDFFLQGGANVTHTAGPGSGRILVLEFVYTDFPNLTTPLANKVWVEISRRTQ